MVDKKAEKQARPTMGEICCSSDTNPLATGFLAFGWAMMTTAQQPVPALSPQDSGVTSFERLDLKSRANLENPNQAAVWMRRLSYSAGGLWRCAANSAHIALGSELFLAALVTHTCLASGGWIDHHTDHSSRMALVAKLATPAQVNSKSDQPEQQHSQKSPAGRQPKSS